jgi:ubiquinone/menaquinone biosynthesis C-methylase UbiE
MSWVVDAFGPWYPTIYPHRNDAEAERLFATITGHVELAGRRVLDVGCGTGRHLVRIRELGGDPVGLDLSPALLAEAARTGAPLVRADMRALPFGGELFDGLTSLFTSFGYFSRGEDRTVVREAVRVLRPGAFHVLDFLNRDRVLAHPNPESEREADGYRIRERRRIEEDGGGRVVKRVTVRAAESDEPVVDYEECVNLWGAEELTELLEASGLRVLREWGEYDGAPFDAGTSSRHVWLSVKEGG